uniref:Uncharacterized protein n=1 Tax=Rhizophora mucronata TaxID=61149 RepID=A0A2P2P9N4_RHIMU
MPCRNFCIFLIVNDVTLLMNHPELQFLRLNYDNWQTC